jgi:hypothetical protein
LRKLPRFVGCLALALAAGVTALVRASDLGPFLELTPSLYIDSRTSQMWNIEAVIRGGEALPTLRVEPLGLATLQGFTSFRDLPPDTRVQVRVIVPTDDGGMIRHGVRLIVEGRVERVYDVYLPEDRP